MIKQTKPKLTLLAMPEDLAREKLRLDNNTPGCVGSLCRACDKPELVIGGNLPAVAREVRDALACCGYIYDRGTPTKVVTKGGLPKAIPLTPDQIVVETYRLRQPVRVDRHGRLVPMMLPTRVARTYLGMLDEWTLPPLAGICTAPLLAEDGSVRTAQGYDQSTGLWSANVPAL